MAHPVQCYIQMYKNNFKCIFTFSITKPSLGNLEATFGMFVTLSSSHFSSKLIFQYLALTVKFGNWLHSVIQFRMHVRYVSVVTS